MHIVAYFTVAQQIAVVRVTRLTAGKTSLTSEIFRCQGKCKVSEICRAVVIIKQCDSIMFQFTLFDSICTVCTLAYTVFVIQFIDYLYAFLKQFYVTFNTALKSKWLSVIRCNHCST